MLRPHKYRPACNYSVTLPTSRQNDLYPQGYHYTRKAFSTKDSNVKSVAVLGELLSSSAHPNWSQWLTLHVGAGISGLTAAFYLTKKAPGLPVTIYDSSPRVGGWLRTRHFETNKGRVEFESGPRTIRPFGDAFLVTTDMVRKCLFQFILGYIEIVPTGHEIRHRWPTAHYDRSFCSG